GVVYYLPDAGTCFHVFLDQGLEPVELPPRRITDAPTFFERARDAGVRCLANPGELANWPSAWTDAILRGAERVPSPTDWKALRHDPVAAADAAVRETEAALGRGPLLVWTFVNFDDYLHRRGYDQPVLEALARLERAAAEALAAPCSWRGESARSSPSRPGGRARCRMPTRPSTTAPRSGRRCSCRSRSGRGEPARRRRARPRGLRRRAGARARAGARGARPL